MNEIIEKQEFAIFALVLIAESLKVLFLGTATAFRRGKTGKFINQEDADWLGGETVVNDELEPARLYRAHRNSLENLVPFSILGMIYMVIGASGTTGILYFIIFFSSRLVHTYAYLNRRPMLRRNTYSIAWMVQLAMAVHVSISVIGITF